MRNSIVSQTAQVALTVSMPFFSATCFTSLDSATENLVHGCGGEEPTPELDPSEWMGIGLRALEEAGQQDGWARLSAVGTKCDSWTRLSIRGLMGTGVFVPSTGLSPNCFQ